MNRVLALLTAACGHREPISLRTFLLFAFLIRLPAVFWSRGYEFVDHQFQYVDPAYHLAFDGSWYRSWEWERGMRSYAYPYLLAGLFRLSDWLSLREPEAMMIFVRLCHGLVSLLPLVVLWHLTTKVLRLAGQRQILLFTAVSGVVIYAGVQPNGLLFGGNLSVAAVLLAMIPGRSAAAGSGLLLGFAFACRFQDAFFGPVLFVGMAAQRRSADALFLCIGAAVGVLTQGLLDLLIFGTFLHSPLEYVKANFFENKAATFGRDSGWLYVAALAALAAFLPPFLRRSAGALMHGARLLPLPMAAALCYVAIHALVERKAVRFVVPALMLWTIVLAVGLFRAQPSDSLARLHRRIVVGLHLLLAAFLSCYFFNRGPVEAALALRARADFNHHLVLVDNARDPATVGGHFYLGRKNLEVLVMAQEELADRLPGLPAGPVYVLVCDRPLWLPGQPPDPALELVGAFRDWPEFRRSTRRFLYRLRPER